ncbi:hypothetical protein HYR54_03995 [Candidatus Acetothermia bacterium]|nr:hypothetical protein [Candidatus Acetothermia bacterium]
MQNSITSLKRALAPKNNGLNKLAQRINTIPTVRYKRFLMVMDDWGHFDVGTKSPKLDVGTERFGAHPRKQVAIVEAIERLKELLGDSKWKYFVGVCRLKTCQKFYIKSRQDAMYCKHEHAVNAQVRKHQEKKKKQVK